MGSHCCLFSLLSCFGVFVALCFFLVLSRFGLLVALYWCLHLGAGCILLLYTSLHVKMVFIPRTCAKLRGYLECFDAMIPKGATECETEKVRVLLAAIGSGDLVWIADVKDEFEEMELVLQVYFDSNGNGVDMFDTTSWMAAPADHIIVEEEDSNQDDIVGEEEDSNHVSVDINDVVMYEPQSNSVAENNNPW